MQIRQSLDEASSDIGSSVKYAFSHTYTADGVDHIDKTLNGSVEAYRSASGDAYKNHPLTLVSGFFGFPNRKLRRNEGQSWGNLARNFIGYQEDASVLRLMLNFLLMVPLNLIRLPFKLVLNTLKLVTEMAPALLSHYLCTLSQAFLANNALNYHDMRHDPKRGFFGKILPSLGYGALFVLGAVPYALGLGCFIMWAHVSPRQSR